MNDRLLLVDLSRVPNDCNGSKAASHERHLSAKAASKPSRNLQVTLNYQNLISPDPISEGIEIVKIKIQNHIFYKLYFYHRRIAL